MTLHSKIVLVARKASSEFEIVAAFSLFRMLLRLLAFPTRLPTYRTMATAAIASRSTAQQSHFVGATPHDSYLDLKFTLPEKRYVGCLACQRGYYLYPPCCTLY
jgi:hypothetical protein